MARRYTLFPLSPFVGVITNKRKKPAYQGVATLIQSKQKSVQRDSIEYRNVSPFVGVIHQQTKEMSSSEVFSKKQMNKENLFNFLKK